MKVTIYKARDVSQTVLGECETGLPIQKGDEIAHHKGTWVVKLHRYKLVGDVLELSIWVDEKGKGSIV